jgi:tetratricopeptide (TPR) repeat protein
VNSDEDMAATPSGGPDLPDRAEAQRLLAPRYEVTRLLGRGASAAVFEVRDGAAGGARRAVKLTDLRRAPYPDALRDSLRTEFLLASRFDHPNLVRCHELDLPADAPLAVTNMEFVDGRPFASEQSGGDAAVTARLAIELLRGLQFLHECGFVHADVKPSNVLCRVQGDDVHAKLLDYHLTFSPALTTRNRPRGTLRYMAPEAIAGEPVDGRADLYSVGVLVYEGLTGRALFEGSVGDVVTQHVTAAVSGLDEAGRLGGVVARLLAKRPAGRYVSAAEAIEAVAEAAELVEAPETEETLLARVRSAPCTGRAGIIEEARQVFAGSDETGAGPHTWLLTGPPGSGRSRLLAELRALAQANGWYAGEIAPSASPRKPSAAAGRRRLLTLDCEAADGEDPGPSLRALAGGASASAAFLCIKSGPDRAVREATQALGAARPVRTIEMEDLSADERMELVASMLPADAGAGLANRLARACGGLPGVAAATVEHLISEGLVGPEGVRSGGLPPVVPGPESLCRRWRGALDRAPAAVRDCAALLAASREALPLTLCALALDRPEPDLVELLRRAEARVLLEECRIDGARGRCLRHEALRPLVADVVGSAEMTRAHRRLAAATARWERGTQRIWRARRARHLLLGGEQDDGIAECLELAREPDRWDVRPDYLDLFRLAASRAGAAERLLLQEAAADSALARGDYSAALRDLEEIRNATGLPPADSPGLACKTARALSGLGQSRQAAELLEACRRRGAGSEEGTSEWVQVELQLGRCALAASRLPEAGELLARAAGAAEQAGDRMTLGAALSGLGRVASVGHELAKAREYLTAAEAALRQAGDRVGTARALLSRGFVEIKAGGFEASERDLTECLRLLQEPGCGGEAARALVGLGSLMQMSNRWQAAIDRYEEALRLADEYGATGTKTTVLSDLSQVRAAMGWLEAAWDDAEAALRLAQSFEARAMSLNRLGRVQYALGLFGPAHDSFVANIEAAESAGSYQYVETGERMAAATEMAEQRLGEARPRLERALRLCTDKLGPTREAVCRVRLVELAAAEGRADEALAEAGRAWDAAVDQPSEHARVRVWLGRSKAYLLAGRPEAAIDDLHRADEVLRQTGVWDDQVETNYELGRAYTAAGKPRFAAVYYGKALNTVEQVAGRLTRQENYRSFLTGPLAAEVFRAIRELRHTASAR